MLTMNRFRTFIICYFYIKCVSCAPNIVIILADDMGFNDVGFHGSNQIPTPNIDALAYSGIILNDHYVLPICTPSRSAMVTGKYPIRLGMQGFPISPVEPRDLPSGKILPEYFKDLGYSTKLVGKWHLGNYKRNSTPTYRGFDSHFGHLTGFISYYDYILEDPVPVNNIHYSGFDLMRDMEPQYGLVGEYLTDLYTRESVDTIKNHDQSKPLFLLVAHNAPHAANRGKLLEAPQDRIEQLDYIIDPNRRTYAAMVSKLDDSVGKIVEALDKNKMLTNTIILFMSDNGAPSIGFLSNWGSNWPLRGIKQSLWEGSVRGVTAVWSPWFRNTPKVSNNMFHIVDWLPTLYSAAGGDISDLGSNIDGLNQWPSLVKCTEGPRNEALINIDEKINNYAIRYRNWKLILGKFPDATYNEYSGESGKENKHEIEYDINAVLNSPTMLALNQTNINSTVITELRKEATLKCLNLKDRPNKTPSCTSLLKGCLYDLSVDPCEERDVSTSNFRVKMQMRLMLYRYQKELVPQINKEKEPLLADPKNFNYTWKPWREDTFNFAPTLARSADLGLLNIGEELPPLKLLESF